MGEEEEKLYPVEVSETCPACGGRKWVGEFGNTRDCDRCETGLGTVLVTRHVTAEEYEAITGEKPTEKPTESPKPPKPQEGFPCDDDDVIPF